MTLDSIQIEFFFTHDDCLKVDIQYQKILKIPKFGLTEGVIFNSENGKLSCWQKWQYRQISEMGGENFKILIRSYFILSIFSMYHPSRAEGGPEGADRGEAHLNDVRFNSN